MFGGLGDMGKMLKQIGEMKTKMSAVEKELQGIVIKKTSRDGALEVEISGKMRLKSVRLLKELNADRSQAEKTIFETISAALDEVSGIAQQKLSAVTGGLKLPGL
ncbi:MAG: YbaB/EbfC family nucleoid-associated protein [Candidatus Margulisbacteria bacterium]|jgi:DNA-binding protein YbaB|nr:YbaB/EbfC family nucleoid-associated protein [Candidatus Margulisiibacteriota bacterium]